MSQAKHTKQTKKTNPHKPKRDAKSFIKFLLVAALLLLAIDYFFWKEERPYVAQIRENYYAEKQAEAEAARQKIESLLPPKVVYPEDGSDYFEAPSNLTSQIDGEAVQKTSTSDPKISVLRARPAEKMEEGKTNYDNITIRRKKSDKPPKVLKEPSDKPDIKSEAPIIPSSSKPKIAIVIDDVGMNITQSQRAISLPAQVTLALLPYANSVQQMAQQAKGRGHELIIHTPMEALSSDVPLGSMALMSDMDAEAFNHEFDRIANSFEGYSGVNNHMGSLLTQDEKAMGYLMDHLKKRGLYFLDSRTIHTSVAEDVAAQYDVPHAVRDVFLDHEETAEYTDEALMKVEHMARLHGSVIAIGHPKEITMDALQAWLPTLEAKGFELVPVSNLMKQATPPKVVLKQSHPLPPE